MKKAVWIFLISAFLFELAMAQTQVRTRTGSNWRRNTAVVLFSGIGGALLGLSTLSFYGAPQEHTGNITTGALLGVMAGTGYLVYENAPVSKPKRAYDYYGLFAPDQIRKPSLAAVPQVQFEFTF
jgi:hypothetical protein